MFEQWKQQLRRIWSFLWPPELWENHADLPEIAALQGRTPEDEGTGDRGDEDADDDEDEEEEDEGFSCPTRRDEKPPDFVVNMYNALRESECE